MRPTARNQGLPGGDAGERRAAVPRRVGTSRARARSCMAGGASTPFDRNGGSYERLTSTGIHRRGAWIQPVVREHDDGQSPFAKLERRCGEHGARRESGDGGGCGCTATRGMGGPAMERLDFPVGKQGRLRTPLNWTLLGGAIPPKADSIPWTVPGLRPKALAMSLADSPSLHRCQSSAFSEVRSSRLVRSMLDRASMPFFRAHGVASTD
jgi:hypothetical protein